MNYEETRKKMEYFASSLNKGYKLSSSNIIFILQKVRDDILLFEPNILSINAPLYVVGSINGNCDDLKSVFDIGGPLPYSTYLFLGNYSGNNNTSLNTVLLLLIYKYIYKNHFFLIQGSLETSIRIKNINEFYFNKIQLTAKKNHTYLTIDQEVMNLFQIDEAFEIFENLKNTFRALPLAAIIGQLYFCADNKYNPGVDSLDLLRRLDRTEKFGRGEQSEKLRGGAGINDFKNFLKTNKLNFVILGLDYLSSNNVSLDSPLFRIYSSPHTTSSDCYMVEINEAKIAKFIKMNSILKKDDDTFQISNVFYND